MSSIISFYSLISCTCSPSTSPLTHSQNISVPTSIRHSDKSLALLGLLANYNKFEFRNPYLLRFEEYVNSGSMEAAVQLHGLTCSELRDSYVAVQDDAPVGWTVGSTLSYVGLGVLAPGHTAPVVGPEEAQERFSML